MAIKVHLRQKALADGKRASLYLDFYPAIPNPKKGGTTRRQFLQLYIYLDPKGYAQRDHNRNTLEAAEQIRTNRTNELNKNEVYTYFEKEQNRLRELRQQTIADYLDGIAETKYDKNKHNYTSAAKYWRKFDTEGLTFENLEDSHLTRFKRFLSDEKSPRRLTSNLSNETQRAYFNKIKSALKKAYAAGITSKVIGADVKGIKKVDSRRQYLEKEELVKLVNTPCHNPLLRRAALFSALTGLRFSDIQKLKWENIARTNSGYELRFEMKKTSKHQSTPISKQAYGLTEGAPDPDTMPQQQQVFDGLKYHNSVSAVLAQWVALAGIQKKITFHCFRHSYAVLQLDRGTDLYTVSKMLGHTDIRTTQVYADILDRNKRQAADRIDLGL